MNSLDDWPDAPGLTTARLRLEPLRVDHVTGMVHALSDPDLYRFTGGTPPTDTELRRRYEVQTVGWSAHRQQRWFNWVVRSGDTLIGYVQTTIERLDPSGAEAAWVIGTPWQGQGYAVEAAMAMTSWLRAQGMGVLVAHINPAHPASAAVARRLGLHPTAEVVDGETRWERIWSG